MALILKQSPASLRDLEAITDYIAEHAGLKTAHKVLTAIEQSCDRLCEFPSIGVSCHFGAEFAGLRMHPVTHYPITSFSTIRLMTPTS